VKSHGGLFARIVEVENLRLAMQAAARGRRVS
jgi:hypothetical protein